MFILVGFDIGSDRKRRQVADILKGYGIRVQKSVFECSRLTDEQLLNLERRLKETIDSQKDSVRFYRLCRSCLKNASVLGVGEKPVEQTCLVI